MVNNVIDKFVFFISIVLYNIYSVGLISVGMVVGLVYHVHTCCFMCYSRYITCIF